MNITIQQMLALDAVVTHGSVQAGAADLNKTHPTVIKSLKNLEEQLGFELFNRAGYRMVLTEQGQSFYKAVKPILNDINALKSKAEHLSVGEEPELNIVLGDITPIAQALKVLHRFSMEHPHTRLNLFFENLSGPCERLLNGKADLIIHHIDKSDPRYEYKDFCQVPIVPVVAPGFLLMPITKHHKYSELKDYTQCIIRDTATTPNNVSYFVNEDAPHITVGDQHTKKQVILERMAWGHMPLFLVENELLSGELLSIEGKYIKGHIRDIVIARLSEKPKGIMLEKLWECF